jgi:hypothetical protein
VGTGDFVSIEASLVQKCSSVCVVRRKSAAPHRKRQEFRKKFSRVYGKAGSFDPALLFFGVGWGWFAGCVQLAADGWFSSFMGGTVTDYWDRCPNNPSG